MRHTWIGLLQVAIIPLANILGFLHQTAFGFHNIILLNKGGLMVVYLVKQYRNHLKNITAPVRSGLHPLKSLAHSRESSSDRTWDNLPTCLTTVWHHPRYLYRFFQKLGDTPKWVVKIMEIPIKMDDLRGNPLFSETAIYPGREMDQPLHCCRKWFSMVIILYHLMGKTSSSPQDLFFFEVVELFQPRFHQGP